MSTILFFLDKYPNLSETFISDQISGLLKLGADIRIVAITGNLNEISPDLEQQFKLSSRVRYLTKARGGRLNALARLIQVCANLHNPNVRLALRSNLFGPCAKKGFLAELVGNISSPICADVIISHFGTTSVTAMALIKLGLLQGKLVPIFHGFDLSVFEVKKTYIKWYQELFCHSARVLAVSQLWLQRLEEMGCLHSKLELLRMGVDPNKFSFRGMLPANNRLTIISVGRLTDKKGYITALRGIHALINLGIDVQYTIIGSGNLKRKLVQLIHEMNLTESVTLVGAVSPNQLPAYLSAASIFMLTSETADNGDMEGVPVSLMEAMSIGLVTVSTHHSGIPELITNGKNGFLVDERDHNALAYLLKDIAIGVYDLNLIALAAREKVNQDFNQAIWVSRLHHICEEIINAP